MSGANPMVGRRSFLAAAVLTAAGCGGGAKPPAGDASAEARRRVEYDEVWGLYSLHVQFKHKPPTKVGDVAEYKNGYPLGHQAVTTGKIMVAWGTAVAEVGSGSVVLAYAADAPTAGGQVLMNDGTIKVMTAAEVLGATKKK